MSAVSQAAILLDQSVHSPTSWFDFLGLPGEIRNQIYNYVVRSTSVKLRPLTEPEKLLMATSGDHNLLKWKVSIRTSLGLSQTSRQVRSEMLPLHYRRTTHTILGRDINQYITDFFPEKARSCGRVIVNLRHSMGHTLDLLPVLKMSITAPYLEITIFGLLPLLDLDLLTKLLSLRGVKVWQRFIQDSVASISYSVSFAETLKIVVKPSVQADWMPWYPTVDMEGRSKKVRGAATLWRMKVGLGGFAMPCVEVLAKEAYGSNVG